MSKVDCTGYQPGAHDPNKDFVKKSLDEGYLGTMIPNSRPAQNRIMVGIPTTGTTRMEWNLAFTGQVTPCNWSRVDNYQWLSYLSPIDFLVADARNVVVHQCIEQGFEWLFFLDHDTMLPPGAVLKINERMLKADVPIWSGLYFTKSVPSEPLVYRGNGTSYYTDWKLGDEVWVTGIPMGCTMIHASILSVLYEESEAYEVSPGMTVRRVFQTPARTWYDPERMSWFNATGTEDIEFCRRVMSDGIFKKAGWPDYEEKEFPFLIDTSIFCKHIDPSGVQYPSQGEQEQFM